MNKRSIWLGLGVVAVAVAVAVGIVGFSSAGDSSPDSNEDYAAVVVRNRDRVDFALGRLSAARSLEELLTRMDEAAAAINTAAEALSDVTPPETLDDAHGRLVGQVEALSADIQGTADQAREPGFEDILLGADGLNFESWDAINTILEELRKQGIKVELLSRHATT